MLRTWETDTAGLDQYEAEFNIAHTIATTLDSEAPPLKSGDHCKWCPAAPTCPQKTGLARMALLYQPDDLASLSQSMDMVGELKAWIKQVESAVYDQLEVGAPVKGWKLVAKRATAKWNDEEAALKSFARKLHGLVHVTNHVIKSPAQMKKVAKAQGANIDWHLAKFEVKKSSGSTLAPEADKRPAVMNAENLQAALDAIS